MSPKKIPLAFGLSTTNQIRKKERAANGFQICTPSRQANSPAAVWPDTTFLGTMVGVSKGIAIWPHWQGESHRTKRRRNGTQTSARAKKGNPLNASIPRGRILTRGRLPRSLKNMRGAMQGLVLLPAFTTGLVTWTINSQNEIKKSGKCGKLIIRIRWGRTFSWQKDNGRWAH